MYYKGMKTFSPGSSRKCLSESARKRREKKSICLIKNRVRMASNVVVGREMSGVGWVLK